MTKAAELAILDDAIRRLGTRSYCGPWLAGVRDEVADEMRCDLFPAISVRDTARQCEQLKAEAAELVKQAGAQADKIRADARAEASNWRASVEARVASNLRSALQSFA